jgi:FKBP-type peptidyl-prolyl cis-trans isomerase 2
LWTLSTAALLALTGCAPPAVVQPGDRVEIGFTCRLPGGELAASTQPDAALANETKSVLYLPRTGPEMIEVTAGPQPPEIARRDRMPFEEEIVQRLALTLPGLQEGQQVQRDLEAERYPAASANERSVRMATTRKREKELRLSREEYTLRTGREPEVGQPFASDPLLPGTVSEVRDKEVLIRFKPLQGQPLELPFGPVTVRELDDRYELDIAAESGRLIRTGAMAGRISAVADGSMTLDFGHPFGGEKLRCAVRVGQVIRPAPAASTSSAAAPALAAAEPLDQRAVSAALLKDALRYQNETAPVVVAAVAGDLAIVNYSALLEDGTVFYSTRLSVADDPAVRKTAWFKAPKNDGGEVVAVGKAALLPGIGEALNGMNVGEKKRITLNSEQAFGSADPQKLQQLPLVRRLPLTVTIPAEEYVKRFNGFPTIGQEVPLTPYFPARVTMLREKEVELNLLAQDGIHIKEPFGETVITVGPDGITTTLTPVIGGLFPVQGGVGVITAADATTFTLDTNNPLAGKTITIDLELTALTPAAGLPAGDLPWQEEHAAGLSKATAEGKPVVLVLHADWCGFCKRLFSETMPDARISSLRDRFVWIRVNSDQQTDIKKLYGQEGYPMIVLFRADGSRARTLDGYQNAAVLRAALQEVL